MVDRRALAVALGRLRIRADEAVEVARLELVRVARERLEVADAVVARAGGERVGRGQRAQRRVAAGAGAADRHPAAVDLAGGGQVARGGDAVGHVDDAPRAVQPRAIGAPVARAAAVVDVDDGEAAARPELGLDVERVGRAAGRAAVRADEQRRSLVVGRRLAGVGGGVEERVGRRAAGRREGDLARDGDPGGFEVPPAGGGDDLLASGLEIDHDDRLALCRARARVGDPPPVADQRPGGRPLDVDALQGAAGCEAREPRAPALRHGADDRAVVEERVGLQAERPQRLAQLGLDVGQRDRPVVAEAVEVPPPRAVGDEVQLAGGAPRGADDRFLGPAGDALAVDPQRGPVPRHPRVLPAEQGEPLTVGRGSRGGEEVVAGGDEPRLLAPVRRDRDDVVDRFATLLVALTHAHDGPAVRRRPQVGVAQRARRGGLGRDRPRLAAGVLAVEAPVGVVGEDHGRVAEGQPPAAAVLVHARANVEARRREIGALAARLAAHEDRAPALGRAALRPDQRVAGEGGRAEAQLAGQQDVRAQRRAPRAVGGGHAASMATPGRRARAGSPAHRREGRWAAAAGAAQRRTRNGTARGGRPGTDTTSR